MENKRKPWTEEELKFLRENINRLSTNAIAQRLGRSRYAVYIKARQEGIYPTKGAKEIKETEQ
jgi:hypothetical protein